MTLDTDHSETESINILTLTLCWRRILMASTWSPWLALCRGARPFLVLTEMGAPRCSIASTTFSWPDLAAQWRSQPVPGLGLEVCSFVQQQPHHVTLAHLGCHVWKVWKLKVAWRAFPSKNYASLNCQVYFQVVSDLETSGQS